MDNLTPEKLERIRQQFDFAPYPRVPLDKSPREDYHSLFLHNMVTPYYLRHQRVVDTNGALIMDAGCGSGYKALTLALSNPGARVVGVDLSPASVELADLRLKHHGITNAEFHAIALEDLPELGLKFDFINCDETLYLLPNPTLGLTALRSVLKPDGIIRGNLHSYFQRENFYQAQDLFRMMGLMDGNPEEFEIGIVTETMKTLKNDIRLKVQAWGPRYEAGDHPDQVMAEILANHLLLEDKGFTIPQLFAMFAEAGLEFISMVNWLQWQLPSLFKDPTQLPPRWQALLDKTSVAEQLHLFELLHPVNRLFDFWCGHPRQSNPPTPVAQWDEATWQRCTVHLHPLLRIDPVREHLKACIDASTAFEISRYIKLSAPGAVMLDSPLAATLLPLWEQPQPIQALVHRYLQIRPLHPATLEPVAEQTAFQEVKQLLEQLEAFCYVLLEPK
ncbi:class I SAM-dependent methyltransferase [Oscillatoria sp. FACHB-1407]|uniref:class I SAM-dependent methyltransferase n=1 Tax=Oscillatoria sp. FACHB-1407 TaxID=2692847 RepID=UPI0016836A13|nr:class I SAM-dependent methyltransferase [Oscillatoria sp. FACHB-1407]MBD2464960.1 class I SAM-dependent methyltransferase [Oscillatoria sp. FACHB-1407]